MPVSQQWRKTSCIWFAFLNNYNVIIKWDITSYFHLNSLSAKYYALQNEIKPRFYIVSIKCQNFENFLV